MRPLEVRRLGRTRFEDVHALQRDLVDARADDKIIDVLILTEHEPVITVGRGTKIEAIGSIGMPVVEIERGGEATYHGPGQLVAYPILRLPEGRRDLHRYLRDLEETVIGVLGEFGVAGTRRHGFTGVWIGERKVCSIGVAVRRWVTYHGLAINLHNELRIFQRFRPCGLDPRVMTRLADHVELPPTNLLGEVLLVKHFCQVFGMELAPPDHPMDPPGQGSGYLPLPVL